MKINHSNFFRLRIPKSFPDSPRPKMAIWNPFFCEVLSSRLLPFYLRNPNQWFSLFCDYFRFFQPLRVTKPYFERIQDCFSKDCVSKTSMDPSRESFSPSRGMLKCVNTGVSSPSPGRSLLAVFIVSTLSEICNKTDIIRYSVAGRVVPSARLGQ